jgi:sugar phosphate isomerase/epimerase
LGAEVLQIADNLPLGGLSGAELKELRTFADGNGIALEAGTAGLIEDNLLAYLRAAEILGAKILRTLPHCGNDFPTLDTAKRRIAAVLPRLAEAEVTLAVENHDRYPSRWLKNLVAEFADKRVGICLDAVNNFGQGENFNEVLNNLAVRTVNFHCKDFVIRRRPDGLGFEVTGAAAGCGMLDLKKARRKIPAGVSWIVELWPPAYADLAVAAQKEADWAQQSVFNLKRLK